MAEDVQVSQEPVDMLVPDENKSLMQASDGTQLEQLADGSVLIGVEIGGNDDDGGASAFDDNLADRINDMSLSMIGADILQGIEADIQSRLELVETYAKGMDLLGLKPQERANKQTRKSVSTIQHPVLLESVITFQSNALGEMLPASGPVKVQVIGGDTQAQDTVADALQEDMNAYLMDGAPEYYPDMDRGLFSLGYGGTLFKKVYHHPIKKRPVSECVMIPDLIVSEDAVSLDSAIRITHRSKVSPADMRRMQVGGVWRDIDLNQPTPTSNTVDAKIKNFSGIAQISQRPQDALYEVYECYTDLDPTQWGLPDEGQKPGLYLPYRITMEKDSRKILDLRRNWREGDADFKKRTHFVMYGLVPSFGFLCLGFLHLLGNQARAMTAAWRIMMDGGMFSNFPGGLRIKGTRQTTNDLNPGPGEFVEVDTGPLEDIRQAFMPMPYKDVSPVFMQFVELVNKNVQGISGAVELQSGEGTANIPVGTIMAMIEQQTKIMLAVHKRMHHAQALEFRLLKELFEEDPASLTNWIKNPARTWTAEELQRYELIPVSDPNIPSQASRIMTATALVTLASQNPDIYDKIKVHRKALQSIGINDADDFLHPAPPPPQPQQDPAVATAQATLQLKQQELQMKQQQQQREAAQGMLHAKEQQDKMRSDNVLAMENNRTKERVAAMQAQIEQEKMLLESAHRDADRRTDTLHKVIDSVQSFGGKNYGDSQP